MFFNRGKRAKQITVTLLVLIFTFSIVLVLPQTIKKTTTQTNNVIIQENETNSKSNRRTIEWNQTFGGINHDRVFGLSRLMMEDIL